MEKKTQMVVGIVAVSLIALLGFATAFNMGPFGNLGGKWKGQKNISQAEIDQMKNFSMSVKDAIANNDFPTWKSLMESQLTQENFDKLVQAYKNHSEMNENGSMMGGKWKGGHGGRDKNENETNDTGPENETD